MRWPALLLPLLLGACVEPMLGPAAVVSGASLVVTGRTPVDHVAGWVSGMDCSAVRLERHGPWCLAPAEPAPEPVCRRTIGSVDCWMPAPPPLPAATPPPVPAATPRS
jgi:hypothetical protein